MKLGLAIHPRFNLLRYFSLASLVVVLLATIGVGYISYIQARDALRRNSEAYAGTIAQNLSYQLQTDPLFAEFQGAQSLNLNQPGARQALAAALPARLYGFGLAKVKLLALDGAVVFSTEPADVGATEDDDEGFIVAKRNEVFSMYGTTAHDAEKQTLPPSFIETYVPLLTIPVDSKQKGQVVGVLEIYQDVTALNAAITQTGVTSALSVAGSMLLLYLALFLIVVRADRVIVQQTQALEEKNAMLQRSQQLRDDLTNMIVHDLRNPLTAVLGNIELLKESNVRPGRTPPAEIVNAAEASGYEMLRLINDLLDVSKLEEGDLKLDKGPLQIAPLLQERVERVEAIAQRDAIEVTVEAPADLTVQADARLIGRVVDNLLSNALHHTRPGGHIRLSGLILGDGATRVTVADDGEGIPPDFQKRIFDKFVQLESRQLSRNTGSGLGLTFCKLVVEAHGGRIWVESEPGKGSQFHFTLPVS
ncbi:MAG: HAMP domain-containing sensor histidine kinase [Anaerolineae bacterium]